MKKINNKIKIYEKDIIKQFVSLFKLRYPKLVKYLYRIPLEGSRLNSALRYGLRKGLPDFILDRPSFDGKSRNLYIEFKVNGNKQTEEQILFQKDAEENGNKYIVCYSAEAAIKIIFIYLPYESYQ